MSIVANLTHLEGAYEMSICNIGIMGTRYTRDGTEYGDPSSYYVTGIA